MSEKNDYKWMVRVGCMTFNHAPYIEDAMNGFTMQQTNFPFVCTIIDDASTDGEQEVINNYLNEYFDLEDKKVARQEETDDYVLTFARHKTNLNCYFAVILLKYNHFSIKKSKVPYVSQWRDKAKYIAICEGDDYWISSDKLQKQVLFLEINPDYVICTHDFIKYFENKKQFDEQSKNKLYLDRETNKEDTYIKFSLDNFFKHWFTQPLTCLYRNGHYLNTIPKDRYKYFRDDIFFYYLLKEGKGAMMKDVMGVYRINDSGTWSTKSFVSKIMDSFYNSYNIYMVEGDKRALFKMNICEELVVSYYLHSLKFGSALLNLYEYYKMIPASEYIAFLFSVFKKILSKYKCW